MRAPAARSTQSPSRSCAACGNIESVRSWASCGAIRSRIDGRGGTGLPDTMSVMGSVSTVPSSRRTTASSTPHASHTPSTSVTAGPPLGPSWPGTRLRITTRWPTTCGPSRC
ncbi:MAG: hypothetical protein R2734_21090 [Nocardioides sp.]